MTIRRILACALALLAAAALRAQSAARAPGDFDPGPARHRPAPRSHSRRDDGGRWTPTDFAAANPALPTLFIAGDSTAAPGDPDHRGWGAVLGDFFDPSKVNVINRAVGGRSFRTFYDEGLWGKIVDALKPGDFVVIEFGHNDGGPVASGPARGDLPGLGEETRDVARKDGSHETVHTFGWYARKFVRDVRAKGATPILSSTTVRNIWSNPKATFRDSVILTRQDGYNPDEDQVERGMGAMLGWIRQVAAEEHVPFVDHSNITADVYDKIGREGTARYFPADHTHTSTDGAVLNAKTLIAGLRILPLPKLLAGLNQRGQSVGPYRKEHWTMPAPEAVSPRDALPFTPVDFSAANPALPTLVIAGDSTADTGPDAWHRGWAALIVDYFDSSKINLVNRARGGRSFRSFVREGLWDKVLAGLKPGDIVMIQFGHNDGGDIHNPNGRADLPGLGEETRTLTRPDGTIETVHTFGWYARKFVRDVRAKGARPVLMATTVYDRWENGRNVGGPVKINHWILQVARAEKAPYLDHGAIISARYDQMGEAAVRSFFPADFLHTSTPGAEVNAQAFVSGVKGLGLEPLVDGLNARGRALPARATPAP